MERPVALPPAVWTLLGELAQRDDVTVGQIIREAVQREMQRRTRSSEGSGPDEAVVAPLRALLADDLAHAAGWNDLDARLRRKGYRLAESGPGLVLLRADGTRMCKASDLGYSHARLTNRFGAPFPGHAQGHVVVRQRLANPGGSRE
jgi:hypothetical protein